MSEDGLIKETLVQETLVEEMLIKNQLLENGEHVVALNAAIDSAAAENICMPHAAGLQSSAATASNVGMHIDIAQTSAIYPVLKWHKGEVLAVDDCIAEEVPIAMIYNGISHTVMLASPHDLHDFALGFSLAEGILSTVHELYSLEVVHQHNGIELHLEIASERFHHLKDRRRSMTGRTGCGLCGAESLDQALRLPDTVITSTQQFSHAAILKALQEIQGRQELQAKTGATHASAWVKSDGEIMMVREDVGRHNALDKLLGARARLSLSKAETDTGFVLTTSRASYEMVQKVAVAGIPMLVAISAPTGLAIRIAQNCGITLVGFARNHQHVMYSHAHRLLHVPSAVTPQQELVKEA